VTGVREFKLHETPYGGIILDDEYLRSISHTSPSRTE
jgi:hypothetical protein